MAQKKLVLESAHSWDFCGKLEFKNSFKSQLCVCQYDAFSLSYIDWGLLLNAKNRQIFFCERGIEEK